MAAIWQTTFPNAFYWIKKFEFSFNFQWNLFPRFQLIITQHWFRCLAPIQAKSHCLDQCWLILLMKICITRPQWVNFVYFSLCVCREEGEWVIRFNGLSGDSGQWDPYYLYNPNKQCNRSLYIGIIIFPHKDNKQYTGHNHGKGGLLLRWFPVLYSWVSL